jgi:hypothetical protein
VVVKLKKHGDLLDDLKDTFDYLSKYKMMLNPKKCVFGVSLGKLLGYMVLAHGIDANPKKRKPLNNCNHIEPEEKSRSWQAWWQHSANSYPSWVNVVHLPTSYCEKQMISSGMIKRQQLLSSSSNI